MTYLGIDYGSKRVGFAKGNSQERLAMPLITLPSDSLLRSMLRSMLGEEKIDEIVVGVPVSFDGKEYAQAREARAFGELIKDMGKPVHFVNEMLTSTQAERSEARDVDASAAALILQSFLDRQRGH